MQKSIAFIKCLSSIISKRERHGCGPACLLTVWSVPLLFVALIVKYRIVRTPLTNTCTLVFVHDNVSNPFDTQEKE